MIENMTYILKQIVKSHMKKGQKSMKTLAKA